MRAGEFIVQRANFDDERAQCVYIYIYMLNPLMEWRGSAIARETIIAAAR